MVASRQVWIIWTGVARPADGVGGEGPVGAVFPADQRLRGRRTGVDHRGSDEPSRRAQERSRWLALADGATPVPNCDLIGHDEAVEGGGGCVGRDGSWVNKTHHRRILQRL